MDSPYTRVRFADLLSRHWECHGGILQEHLHRTHHIACGTRPTDLEFRRLEFYGASNTPHAVAKYLTTHVLPLDMNSAVGNY